MKLKNKDDFRFHHLSIPSTALRDGEVFDEHLRCWRVPGSSNAYGLEWARYEYSADRPALLEQHAHISFEVDDLEKALVDEDVIVAPYQASTGVSSAFIDVLGAPVRLLEVDESASGIDAENPIEKGGKPLIYHHTGMPSDGEWEDEIKVPHLNLAYLPGKLNTYGVEWLRFEEGNKNPDIIKYIPHIAFEVDDIDKAIVGEKVIYHSGRDDSGIIVAMIEVDGASIEFLELDRTVCGDQFDR